MALRISKIAHEYPYGCHRQVGERFEADSQDVELLLRLGRIESEVGEYGYVGEKSITPQIYETRDMSAKQKRKYERKAA